MTLARTALRLAAVAALSGVQGKRPTIAENRVYDSRIGDIDPDTVATDAKPIIIITTDGDEGTPTDLKDGISQNGGPPFWRNIELNIEFSMVARAKVADGYEVGYPYTDAQLEASIDFLEYQARRVLHKGTTAMAIAFRRVSKQMDYKGHRTNSDEYGNKVASRILMFTCRVQDDCDAGPGATGLHALPEPLRRVALAMPPNTYAASTCTAIAAAVVAERAGADPAPPLRSIGLAFDFAPAGTGDGTPDVTADLVLSPE